MRLRSRLTSTSQISPKVLKKLKGATGPRGAAGAPGAAGAAGAIGATGATGMSGYEVVQGNLGAGSASGFNVADSTASCPAGKRVVGGGLDSTGNNADIYLVRSQPSLSGTDWSVRTAKPSTSAYSIAAFAICVNVTA
jgi:hypothetical protein